MEKGITTYKKGIYVVAPQETKKVVETVMWEVVTLKGSDGGPEAVALCWNEETAIKIADALDLANLSIVDSPQTLNLRKEYGLPHDGLQVVTGIIEFPNLSEAEKFKQAMDNREISTSDPRIEWDYEPMEDAEYIDFSFEVVDDD